MIPKHEGRKDPACSAYSYLETAPEEMFNDFSCQLEEYALNREPGYWKNTRFFHDTSHMKKEGNKTHKQHAINTQRFICALIARK